MSENYYKKEEVNVLEDYNPVKIIFKSQTQSVGQVIEYMVDLPEDIKEKVTKQLKDQYGETAGIFFDRAVVTVYSK